jgi:hypothetical protein
VTRELNNFEMIQKNVLQYFHYFIRPEFRQKPDIDVATETYKEIADSRTIEELKKIVGENNLIDFENLGVNKIEFNKEVEEKEAEEDIDDDSKLIEYDEVVDGEVGDTGHTTV